MDNWLHLIQHLLNDMILEQINFEKVNLLGKNLLANPCREMFAGESVRDTDSVLCLLFNKQFKWML